MELFYPAAIQRPGPAGKVWAAPNTIDGIIEHSMQGALVSAWTVLDDESTNAQGSYIAASWTFSVGKDGRVYQHYALNLSPFHAGSKAQNLRLIGVEHEGGPPGNLSEPLTEPQIAASIALAKWIAEQGGFSLSRDVATRTLYEHGEVTATQCPSGRIPWDRYLQPVYHPPFAAFAYVGAGEQPWQHDYELRIQSQQVAPNLQTTYLGREGPDERYRIRVEDWE